MWSSVYYKIDDGDEGTERAGNSKERHKFKKNYLELFDGVKVTRGFLVLHGLFDDENKILREVLNADNAGNLSHIQAHHECMLSFQKYRFFCTTCFP